MKSTNLDAPKHSLRYPTPLSQPQAYIVTEVKNWVQRVQAQVELGAGRANPPHLLEDSLIYFLLCVHKEASGVPFAHLNSQVQRFLASPSSKIPTTTNTNTNTHTNTNTNWGGGPKSQVGLQGAGESGVGWIRGVLAKILSKIAEGREGGASVKEVIV